MSLDEALDEQLHWGLSKKSAQRLMVGEMTQEMAIFMYTLPKIGPLIG
jgi:hypothetical protein